MADKNQANNSTKHAEINMNGNLKQQIIESSVASITKNKSNDVLRQLVKDIRNKEMVNAVARLDAFKKLGKCKLLQLYEIPEQQGESLLHLAIKSQTI